MTTPIPLGVFTAADSPVESMARRLVEKVAGVVITLRTDSWEALINSSNLSETLVLLDADLDEVDPFDRIRLLRRLGARVIVMRQADAPKAVLRDMAAGSEASMLVSQSSRRLASQVRLSAGRAALIEQRKKELRTEVE